MRRPTSARDAAEAAFKAVTAKTERVQERAPVPNAKESVTLRVDAEVLAAFQAEGPGWQDRMTQALRKAAGL